MNDSDHDAQRQAFRFLGEGNPQAASGVVSMALCRTPHAAALWACRARVRAALQDWKGALAAIETALTISPLGPAEQITLGDCYWRANRRELALMAYEHALRSGPHRTEVYPHLYQVFRQTGRHDLALAACEAALAVDPRNHQAHFAVAHCVSRLVGPVSRVEAALRRAVELAPERSAYRISLAIHLVRRRENEEAYGYLCKVDADCLQRLTCAASVTQLRALCRCYGDTSRYESLSAALVRIKRLATKGKK